MSNNNNSLVGTLEEQRRRLSYDYITVLTELTAKMRDFSDEHRFKVVMGRFPPVFKVGIIDDEGRLPVYSPDGTSKAKSKTECLIQYISYTVRLLWALQRGDDSVVEELDERIAHLTKVAEIGLKGYIVGGKDLHYILITVAQAEKEAAGVKKAEADLLAKREKTMNDRLSEAEEEEAYFNHYLGTENEKDVCETRGDPDCEEVAGEEDTVDKEDTKNGDSPIVAKGVVLPETKEIDDPTNATHGPRKAELRKKLNHTNVRKF